MRGWQCLLLFGRHARLLAIATPTARSSSRPRGGRAAVAGLLREARVPRDADFLTLDIDSDDCMVLQALLEGEEAHKALARSGMDKPD